MNGNTSISKKHTLSLDARKSLKITGVTDVKSFDETMIILATYDGQLTIGGRELHIVTLDVEEGCLEVQGEICDLYYTDEVPAKSASLFSRLFH